MREMGTKQIGLGVAMLVILLAGIVTAAGAAGGAELRSTKSQISVMVKVFDAILVESPNVLVAGRSTAQGTYLDSYGILLGARVSLDLPDDWCFSHWPHGIEILKNGRGRRVIAIEDDDFTVLEEERRDEDIRRRREHWDGARAEMIQFLVDYGPTIRGLDGGKKLGISLYRWDALSGEEIPQTMIIEVSLRDLEKFGQGQMSEEDLRRQVKVTEY